MRRDKEQQPGVTVAYISMLDQTVAEGAFKQRGDSISVKLIYT
jgi:hypothetical protein